MLGGRAGEVGRGQSVEDFQTSSASDRDPLRDLKMGTGVFSSIT